MGWGWDGSGQVVRGALGWAVGGYGEVFWMLEVWKPEFLFLIFFILLTRR